MIVTGSLSNFQNSTYDISISVDSPISGFEFSLMGTGAGGAANNMVTFSGQEGYMFDQSGNFFGGYKSGVPIDLFVYYDHTNKSFSYYKNDVLISNNMRVTGTVANSSINHISFTKHANSTASFTVTGVIG
jgi:hypothetical protein|tara:strand:+ start:1377 stop:1769 length:393 start_codon:yes stop_codon:yes gene_type:complete